MSSVTKKTMPPMVLVYITESNGSPTMVRVWQYNPNKRYQRLVALNGEQGGKPKKEDMVLKLLVDKNNFKAIVGCVADRIADMNPAGSADSRPQLVVLNNRQHKMLQDACKNIDSRTQSHVVYLDARIQDIFKYCDDADKIGLEYAAKKLGEKCNGKENSDEYRFAAVFIRTERMLSDLVGGLKDSP
jgi:acyl-homoserine lactone acylase PvdQ